MAKLWSFSNDGGSGAKWKKDMSAAVDAEGLCFGYSLTWCVKSMQHPDKPNLTQPDKFAAGLLQQRAESIFGAGGGNFDAAVTKLVELNGHHARASIKRNWSILPSVCAVEGGHYLIHIGDHWLAYASVGGSYYFFDSNDGLYQFDDALDFTEHATAALKGYKDDTDPKNGWSDTHMAFKVTL